jgi:hypothetical protein
VAIIIAESASGIYFMGSLEVRKEDKKEKEGYIYISEKIWSSRMVTNVLARVVTN